MIITWTIEKLICKPTLNTLSNVVYQVYWTYSKSITVNGENYSVKNNGITSVSDPEVNSFTQYDDLTKSQVLSWVQTELGQEYIAEMDARLSIALTNKSTQVMLPLPFEN